MYSLLIAEDEPLERRALRKIIGGAFSDIVLLPDATNGRETVARVGRFDPDLLLLDIQMPYLNGIEVLKTLRAGGYPGEIIILTAHDQFDYVKDALNYGANAFLLKPETKDKIVRTVGESLERLSCTRQRQMTQQQKESILAGMADYIVRETILRIVDGDEPTSEMLRQLAEMGISFSTGFFAIVELRWRDLEQAALAPDRQRSNLEKARQAVKGGLRLDGMTVVSPVRGGTFSVFLASSKLRSMIWYRYVVSELAKQITELVRGALLLTPRIGVGGAKTEIGHFRQSYLESVQALYQTSEEKNAAVHEPHYLKALDDCAAQIGRMDTAGDAGQLIWQADELLSGLLDQPAARTIEETRGLAAVFWISLYKHFEPDYETNGRYEIRADELSDAPDAGAVRALVRDKLGALLAARRKQTAISPVVRRAMQHIQRHYADDLSLDAMSQALGVTPAYISFLLRRELGQTFSEYLLDVRMGHLRTLLQEGDYSVSELAGRLGYKDAAYFCRVVKKAMGKTVGQIKNELRADGSPPEPE